MPARSTCPFCRDGRLNIYDDSTVGGSWFHCASCAFRGDAIELTSKAWGLTVEASLYKLDESTCSILPEYLGAAHIANYTNNYIDRRERMGKFWELARSKAEAPDHPIARLRRTLGFRESNPSELLSPYIGYADRVDIEECFWPGRLNYRRGEASKSRRTTAGGERGTFSGPGWTHMIVIPFHDLPGRISGFALIGRDGHPTDDCAFRPTLPTITIGASHGTDGTTQRYRPGEAGLAFLPALLGPPSPDFGDTAFVIDDLYLTVRMQAHAIADGGKLLPAVTPWSRSPVKTRRGLEALPIRPSVFWTANPSVALFRQAKAVDGRISLLSKAEILRLDARRGTALLRAVEKSTVGWEAALERFAVKLDRGECEDMFLRLNMTRDEKDRFLDGCGEDARRRLRPILTDRSAGHSVIVARSTIVASPGGWTIKKTGEVICNAPITLERVIHQPDCDRTFYSGRVQFNGVDHPFTVDAVEFDPDPFAWVRRFLLRASAGMPLLSSAWNRHALTIALQLNPPAYSVGSGSVGWNLATRSFGFPKFSIQSGSGLLGNPPLTLDAKAPGSHLNHPRPLRPEEIEALSRNDDPTRLFWAAAGALIANIVAPSVRAQPSRIALVGGAARDAGRDAAAALGCITVPAASARRNGSIWDEANRAALAHPWPIHVNRPDIEGHQDLPPELVAGLPVGSMFPVEFVVAMSQGMEPGWSILDAQGRSSRSAAVDTGASQVLPNYIERLCKNGLFVPSRHPAFASNVLEDLADWLEAEGGSGKVIRESGTVLDADDDFAPARRFSLLVGRMLNTGELVVKPQRGAWIQGYRIVATLDGGLVHLPEPVIRRYLMTHGTHRLNTSTVTRLLSSLGVFRREETVGDIWGWVVPAVWLEQCRRVGLAYESPQLRIAT